MFHKFSNLFQDHFSAQAHHTATEWIELPKQIISKEHQQNSAIANGMKMKYLSSCVIYNVLKWEDLVYVGGNWG